MIHIATVHRKNNFWIDVQKKYLKKNIKGEYNVYGFFNYINEEKIPDYKFNTQERIGKKGGKDHASKLNILADVISSSADKKDIMIFIDADAFPIKNVDTYLRDRLSKYPLISVKREENGGDAQPHPCFCATTVGFWNEINGDWSPGYKWECDDGYRTDVGGNLLEKLRTKNIDWYPLKRSNNTNYHEVLFGIYDDFVYHHGAASRIPLTYPDFKKINKPKTKLENTYKSIDSVVKGICKSVPGLGSIRISRNIQIQLKKRYGISKDDVVNRNKKISNNIKSKIKENERFYECFR